ncbi:hypothetical protein QR98_0046990 [Sarcoptes scabiei]|uniref:Uncharacterized protein n=1 Tax=Sarcoptes scabiei TaxID=52283 RepID=A0A132A5H9_SARSC|nr:hypothetical protein QR98_0046990 [Sarcoptes scabiei]
MDAIRNYQSEVKRYKLSQTIIDLETNVDKLSQFIQNAARQSMFKLKYPLIKILVQKRSKLWDSELKWLQVLVKKKMNKIFFARNPDLKQALYADYQSYMNRFIRMIQKKKSSRFIPITLLETHVIASYNISSGNKTDDSLSHPMTHSLIT